MKFLNKFNLQLFAGEAAGGEGGGEGTMGVGAESGQAPSPREQRLRELGVPEEAIQKQANRRSPKRRNGPDQARSQFVIQTAAQQIPAAEQAQAVPNQTSERTLDSNSQRMTWDEIVADPEYNQRLQQTMNKRLRSAKVAEENMKTLAPALELIARQYQLDPENIDYKALAEAVNNDNAHYEDKALKLGVSTEKARELDIAERDTIRQRKEESENQKQQRIDKHTRAVIKQAEEFKKIYPSFDLMKEMENPRFMHMTHPDVGCSVEEAYFAIHHKDIQATNMEVATKKMSEKLSKSIQANGRRPVENGISGKAPTETTFDYKKASREQKAQIKKLIMEADARGEKVYPGQITMR